MYGSCQARGGDGRGALVAITSAVEGGFTVPQALREHPWLEGIRDEAAAAGVVARARGGAARGPTGLARRPAAPPCSAAEGEKIRQPRGGTRMTPDAWPLPPALALPSCSCSPRPPRPRPRSRDKHYAAARGSRNGWITLRLAGTPAEIGYQRRAGSSRRRSRTRSR